jgi:hypothetical protein
MIKKYNQFVNESVYDIDDALSVHEEINEPFTLFVERAQERLDEFVDVIRHYLRDMDKAIEEIMSEFESILVGKPIFDIESDLSEITVQIHTNVPNNDEAWEAMDGSPAQDLEHRLYDMLGDYPKVRSEIFYKPNEDGNCVIRLRSYIIDSDNFGDFTDALIKMGEDY